MRGFVRLLVHAIIVAMVLAIARDAGAATIVPTTLRDVTGATVDVAELAARQRLVFVTVKATWCPICRAQLRRLGRWLPHLRACGATFVVLVPGTDEAVAAVARDTSFPYPFVAAGAEDLAKEAGFVLAPGELVPGFFAVSAARGIVWEQRGRSDGHYGDDELFAYLGCTRPTAPDVLALSGRSAPR